MGEKRATDHLEPAAKKRGSERQITKDDNSDEEEQLEAGTFARASEDVLKQRKIIRARRGPTSGTATAASSNPFANVQLAPTAGTDTTTAPPPANPFAGVSLVAPTPAAVAPAAQYTAAPAAETVNKEENITAAAVEENNNIEGKEEKAEGKAPAPAEEPAFKPATVTGGFGGFGASAAAPSGGLAFGSSGGFGSVKTGTGGFGFLASAPGTSAFGASTTPAFGAATITATTTTATTTAPVSIFGSATPSGTPAFGAAATKPSLPDLPADVPVTTGEESENTVFSGTAVLFAFNSVKKEWTNRGSGGLKVNVNENTKQARMVMRQKDTLRLLLNANLWPGLNLTAQEGQSAMSFTCFNHVDAPPASEGAAKQGEKDGGEGNGNGGGKSAAATLETYAVKLKKADIPEFIEIVKRYMPKGSEGGEAV